MGQKKQYQMKHKQKARRKLRRKHIVAKGGNLAEYYYGKYYIKLGQEK